MKATQDEWGLDGPVGAWPPSDSHYSSQCGEFKCGLQITNIRIICGTLLKMRIWESTTNASSEVKAGIIISSPENSKIFKTACSIRQLAHNLHNASAEWKGRTEYMLQIKRESRDMAIKCSPWNWIREQFCSNGHWYIWQNLTTVWYKIVLYQSWISLRDYSCSWKINAEVL